MRLVAPHRVGDDDLPTSVGAAVAQAVVLGDHVGDHGVAGIAAADKAAVMKAQQDAEAKATAELKAEQEAEAKATAASKRTTITCEKGKLTKRVTGINPKCPRGFKVKR